VPQLEAQASQVLFCDVHQRTPIMETISIEDFEIHAQAQSVQNFGQYRHVHFGRQRRADRHDGSMPSKGMQPF
jgi:hypothetical protein